VCHLAWATGIKNSPRTMLLSRVNLNRPFHPRPETHTTPFALQIIGGKHQPWSSAICMCTRDTSFLKGKPNMPSSNDKKTKISVLASMSSPSSSQPTAPLTATNLAAHRRAAAITSSTTSSQGRLLSNGEANHRHAPPTQERWNELVEHDPLAAEIEVVLRGASKGENKKH